MIDAPELARNWLGNANRIIARLQSRQRTEIFMPGSLAPELMRRSEDELLEGVLTVLSLIDELEQARGERDENKWCKSKLIQLRAERDAARALLREAIPHIKRALTPYKEGWIEEKADILARIAAELGEW
jgi:hypothetical protein